MRIALPRLGAVLATLVVLTALVAGCGGSSSSSSASGPAAIDRAFVQQMVPHHRLAVDMGNMALKQGEHREIKALAQGIVSTQTGEIALMTKAAGRVGAKLPPGGQMGGGMSMDGPQMQADAKTLGLGMDAMGMSMEMNRLDGARPFDRAFLDMMIPHHQGAVRMARAELAKGGDGELKALAQRIIAGQSKEIAQMNDWRTGWFGAPSPAGGVPAG